MVLLLLCMEGPPHPRRPPPSPSSLLPDCYSTSVSSTVPFLKLILWRSFFRSAIFFPSPPCSNSLAFSLSISLSVCLQDFHLIPPSQTTLPYSLYFSLSLLPLGIFQRTLLMKRGHSEGGLEKGSVEELMGQC